MNSWHALVAKALQQDVSEIIKAVRAAVSPASEPAHEHPNRYRVGRKLGRTVYRDEQFIGVMDTPELGALVVDALNRTGDCGHDLEAFERQETELANALVAANDATQLQAERDQLIATLHRVVVRASREAASGAPGGMIAYYVNVEARHGAAGHDGDAQSCEECNIAASADRQRQHEEGGSDVLGA